MHYQKHGLQTIRNIIIYIIFKGKGFNRKISLFKNQRNFCRLFVIITYQKYINISFFLIIPFFCRLTR